MRSYVLFVLGLLALPPASPEIRLIVKGDDMGAAHGINLGTIDAYKRGVLSTSPALESETPVASP